MADSGNIKVVVRSRPLNTREKNRGASNLIKVVDQHQLVLSPPNSDDQRENARATKKKAMPFSFDRAYDENTEQRELFEYVGLELLAHSFDGFNTCVFAYGQTGSGKSHSMVGYAEAKGLIPLTCAKLFDDANAMMASDPNLRITVEVSYIEIYNEKVRDLLNPNNKGNLKVREHPSLGPYVEDLSKLVVKDFVDIEHLMDEGNKARTVAATNMNETSSRSHAVFTLVLSQKRRDEQTNLEAEKVSRISLVDLAGSERANSTGATGSRLKEGANINRSLTTLGKVIAALAQASMESGKSKRKVALDNFVPYRDSTLTWLLKDSLGGNSKTAMIAAISPADYEETVSTLRYADQAKKIKNKAVVNEDPNAKLIRELKEELEMLRNRVQLGGGEGDADGTWDPSVPPEKQVIRYKTKNGEIKTVTKAELQDQLEQSEKIMQDLNQSWEQKVAQTQKIQIEREKALEELGITVAKGNVGVHTPKSLPHLVNLNEDPLMSECLIYQLKPGFTAVGNIDAAEGSDSHARIRLSGASILPEHCQFENEGGIVTLHVSNDSHTMVNGKRVTLSEPRRLRSGFRIILGEDFRHVFRFNHPEEVRKERDRARLQEEGDESHGLNGDSIIADSNVDWTYARREAALAAVHGHDVDFDALNEDDLEKLYEDITRARSKKVGAAWRPDSQLGSFDDNASEGAGSELRPYSLSAYTDDTSLDPWSANADTSSTLPSMNTPDAEQDTQETIDLRKQVKEYEEQITKLAAKQNINSLELRITYSAREKRLIRSVLDVWRKQTAVTMAATMFSNAVILKEANVISKELNKRTSYQFCIVDRDGLATSASQVEAIMGLSEVDDVADAQLFSSTKPCVAVRVIDRVHRAIYIWSMSKLDQRLQKMRNLYSFVDKPEYSQHFNWADPFYDDSPMHYSFIGAALISLQPLYRRISATYKSVPIFSRYTFECIATCRVEAKYVTLSSSGTSNESNGSIYQEAVEGEKFGCQISVDNVAGNGSFLFDSMHLQMRPSILGGIHNNEVLTSLPAEDVSGLKFRKTFSVIISAEGLQTLRHGNLALELFALPSDAYLAALEQHDAIKEANRFLGRAPEEATKAHDGRPQLQTKSPSSGRLSEKELVSEERHDILAAVQILELSASGEYSPVQVRSLSVLDPGVFNLHQGLQRKISVHLRHDSGQQFPWTSISRMKVSSVRMLDAKGNIHSSTLGEPVYLSVPAKQQSVAFHGNGTSDLECWAWWDSSMHDSVFLNRHTATGHRILLKLSIELLVESCSEPIQIETDVAVAVHGRDSKPPGKLVALLESATTGSRVHSKATSIFAVRLVPPMTRKTQELWRLDTATKYVRGQEALDGLWKPRGASLVHDFIAFTRRERQSAEVEGVRALLKAHPPLALSGTDGLGISHENDQSEMLHRALHNWKSACAQGRHTVLARQVGNDQTLDSEAEHGDTRQSASAGDDEEAQPPAKLRAIVTLIPRSDTTTKRGHLQMPIETFTDQWARRWFALRRPYLYVYETSSELDEIMAIHLGSARIEHDQHIEQMLDRPHVFGLYTASNSYFLQAPSVREMDLWIKSLSIRRG